MYAFHWCRGIDYTSLTGQSGWYKRPTGDIPPDLEDMQLETVIVALV